MTDYTLSFAAGSPVNSMSCVDIVILEDSAVEDIERFYVELSTSDPVNILSPDNATVSILDDDGRSLHFSQFRETCLLYMVVHCNSNLACRLCHLEITIQDIQYFHCI